MADASTPARDGAAGDTSFFGHPRGLSVLFFSEMWERFSFYGMRALLVLYMVKHLGYREDERAYPIYGAYGALVYAFPVIGGWVANQWLGYRRAIILGGVLMALGHFTLALPVEPALFLGLGLLCVGNGFFKPNISSTVGRLYAPEDKRRDRGFTIFYMGINLGAFLAPLACGGLGEGVTWHLGFGLAGVGMVIGLVWFVRGRRHLGGHGEPQDPVRLTAPLGSALGLNRQRVIVGCAFLAAPLAALALWRPEVGQRTIQAVSVAVLLILAWLAALQPGAGKLRMGALILLMFFHMLFWAAFEQAGSSLNIMTDRHVDRAVLGWSIPASIFQSVNALFIVLLAPVLTLLWKLLDSRRLDPSIPVKFGLALVQVGLGFWVLTRGASRAGEDGVMALGWLVACYLLHTTGELCLSPIGLSAVTKLAPERWTGFCMGAWFLTIANAHIIAAAVAKLTGSGAQEGTSLTGKAALGQFSAVFGDVFLFAAAAGIFLIVISPLVKRLLAGVK
ncbi:MAG: peptide MFS transporter [Planctomycetes bacterium]|nr:peptide MFS transporter [Planctomycetota bacterium]